jgi:hypothetical protein
MFERINFYTKITCDKCGFSQTEYGEANDIFFKSGWSMNPRAKKYVHKCGKCNGKHAPNKVWEKVEPVLARHPLIKSIKNVAS